MKCKKCNNTLLPKDRFCPNCGNNAVETTEKARHFPKKAIVILSSCLLLILLSVALYQIGLNAASPKKTVAAFKEAVRENDTEAISSLLQSSLNDWEFKKEDASLLLQYFKEHPNDKDMLFNRLDQKAEELEVKNSRAMFEEKHYAAISLQKKGKKWLLFPNYALLVTPAYIRVAVDKNDAKIFIGETVVEEKTKKTATNHMDHIQLVNMK